MKKYKVTFSNNSITSYVYTVETLSYLDALQLATANLVRDRRDYSVLNVSITELN